MRRILCAIATLFVILALVSAPNAAATAQDAPAAYAYALLNLANPLSVESVKTAQLLLNNAPLYEDYEYVGFLRLYAEALLFMHDDDFESVIINCEIMQLVPSYLEFEEFLKNTELIPRDKSLVSVSNLMKYSRARLSEREGDYAAAIRLLSECMALDYLSRIKALRVDVFPAELNRARALYDEREYSKALDILKSLVNAGYRDAEALYASCQRMLTTPTPTIKPTPTPTPTPKPTPTPTKRPTPTPTPKSTPTAKPTAKPTATPGIRNLKAASGYDGVTLSWDAAGSQTYYISALIRNSYWHYIGSASSANIKIPHLMLGETYTINVSTELRLLNNTSELPGKRLVTKVTTPKMVAYTERNFKNARMEFAFTDEGAEVFTHERTNYTVISRKRMGGYSSVHDFYAILYYTVTKSSAPMENTISILLTAPDNKAYFEEFSGSTDGSFENVWWWMSLDGLIQMLDDATQQYPLGTYKIEVFFDGKLVATSSFRVVDV